MSRVFLTGLVCVWGAQVLLAQNTGQRPHFDTASLTVAQHEVAAIGATVLAGGSKDTGAVRLRLITLEDLISWAYDVESFQVAGVHQFDRYDLNATAPADTPPERLRQMAQTLLEEKLQLRVHREKQEMNVYVISLAQGGPLFHKATGGASNTLGDRGITQTDKFFNGSMSMAFLMHILAPELDHPIVDRTGLTGQYAIDLSYPIDSRTHMPTVPSLATALEHKLGLKLELQNLPLDTIVVDHVEKLPE